MCKTKHILSLMIWHKDKIIKNTAHGAFKHARLPFFHIDKTRALLPAKCKTVGLKKYTNLKSG